MSDITKQKHRNTGMYKMFSKIYDYVNLDFLIKSRRQMTHVRCKKATCQTSGIKPVAVKLKQLDYIAACSLQRSDYNAVLFSCTFPFRCKMQTVFIIMWYTRTRARVHRLKLFLKSTSVKCSRIAIESKSKSLSKKNNNFTKFIKKSQ